MDKVLLRPMFRNRYLKEYKVKKFNQGGIASLTPREKAIYAATFAGPLLQGRQMQGESRISATLRSLGEGVSALPATMLKLEEVAAAKAKANKTKSIRQATVDEKVNILGFNKNDRVVVKVEGDEITDIVSKPTAGEMKDAAKRQSTLKLADDILGDLGKAEKTGRNVSGPLAGKYAKITAALGFNAKAANFNTKLETFRKEAIAALRGAQVGPLEEASFNAILPSITDPENVIYEKIQVSIDKLNEIEDRLGVGGQVTDPGNLDYYTSAFQKFGVNVDDLSYDPSKDFYSFDADGNLVKE